MKCLTGSARRALALGAVLLLLSFGTNAEDPGTMVKDALAKLRAPEARRRRLGAERLAAAVQTAELAATLEGRAAGSGLPRPEECRAALEAVRAAAPELVPLALADPDPDVRGPLQSLFPVFGEAARPLLEQAMQSGDAAVRREAFSYWLRGAKDPAQAWPKVQAAAGDPDPGMRALAVQHAAGTLRRKGDLAPALALLFGALADTDGAVRFAAVLGLRHLPSAPPRPEIDRASLERVLPLLSDPDGRIRAAAAAALGTVWKAHLSATDLPLVEACARAARDPDRQVRLDATPLLAAFGPDAGVHALLPLLLDADSAVARRAVELVVGFGGKGIPAIARGLGDADAATVRAACEAAATFAQRGAGDPALATLVPGLEAVLKGTAAPARARAAFVLGRLRADGAVPALIAALEDADATVRVEAVGALQHIVWQSRPVAARAAILAALHEAARDASPAVRARVAGNFGDAGAPAAEAIATLERAARDPDRGVRQAAARGLDRLGQAGRASLEALRAAEAKAADGDPTAAPRRCVQKLEAEPGQAGPAIEALVALGPSALEAVPALVDVLLFGTAEARPHAAEAVRRIQGEDRALPLLATALADDREEVRYAAAEAAGRFGPWAEPAIPGLVSRLQESSPGHRLVSAQSLGRIGLQAREALPVLLVLWQDPDPQVQYAAGEASVRVGHGEMDGWQRILAAMEDAGRTGEARPGAARGMRELPEPRAREAAPCLARLLAEAAPPHQLFSAVHDALEAMGPAAADAVPILTGQLRTGNPGSRAAAARALGLLGGVARPAVPALLTMLQDGGRADAEAAATAFLLLGPFARPALPALIEAYEADPTSQRGPMVPLAKLGILFPEARQAFARVLVHPDENARLLAVTALGLIRGAAADCLPALDAAAASSSPMVSVAARTVARQLRQPEASDFSTPEELARREEEMRRGFAAAEKWEAAGQPDAAMTVYWRLLGHDAAVGAEVEREVLRRLQKLMEKS